ncbi:hypothetical protein A7E77_13820 [Sphingomonas sp. NIC1]|nr:hypothetical protein A7E77_13820 [Sphingomonas sp. NIC1]
MTVASTGETGAGPNGEAVGTAAPGAAGATFPETWGSIAPTAGPAGVFGAAAGSGTRAKTARRIWS